MENVRSVASYMKKAKNSPQGMDNIGEELQNALTSIERFVSEVTGQAPTQTEIANALQRYFVLNEIKEHIVMERIKASE